ncbi:MAG: endonuclease domain-containing protein [SAR202 cluster bacterium]|nr:endonuclease domain-containing protein [SAR202 cluster bacterium]
MKPTSLKIFRARNLRKNPTDAERLLWSHLRDRQLGGDRFRRQHPIGKYIVDFVCLKRALVVELDGGQHSDSRQYDADRTAHLDRRGFKVIRFWKNQALTEVDGVKVQILKYLVKSDHD